MSVRKFEIVRTSCFWGTQLEVATVVARGAHAYAGAG